MTFSWHTTIAETDLDILGHLNNALYLRFFELARWDFLNQEGFSLESIRESGIAPVVLEVHLKYLKEINRRQEITILSQGEGFQGKVGRIRQSMYRSDEALACQADFVFGVFDLKKRKLIAPPIAWQRLLNKK